MSKIAIYVPAYNQGRKICHTLDRIPKHLWKEVVEVYVVDNASTDDTYAKTVAYKKDNGLDNLNIIRNEENRGYGGSQKVAYQYAIERGYDTVIMLHADGQYAPDQIPNMLDHFEKTRADMAFGSRIAGDALKGRMPLIRYLGNRFLTMVENFVLRWNLSEFHSGFRIYSVDALRQVPFHLCSDYYEFDTEILIQFKISGLTVAERPIPTHYGDERSYINIWVYGFRVLGVMTQYLLHKARLKKCKKFEVGPAIRARRELPSPAAAYEQNDSLESVPKIVA